MKIGIVAWSLFENMGGVERLCCSLAEALITRGHHVTLLCKESAKRKDNTLCRIPDGCGIAALDLDYDTVSLDDARVTVAGLELDVLAALFSWESLLWFPSLVKGTGVPLVISEHGRPEWINGRWNAYERHCCLECADAIHVLLHQFVAAYPGRFLGRIHVIPNPACLPETEDAIAADTGRHVIVSAGRFAEMPKQFSLLIKAFAMLKDAYPDWDLEICGDGPSMGAYKRLSEQLGLGGRLRLPGMIADIGRHYAAADIFCIPSSVEGFGMVTVEAQAWGLPAVGFASCSGVNEIIVHGENGSLAEEMTYECLATHLATLMGDAGLRRRMGARGREMLERYAPDRVYDAWEAMLRDASEKKEKTRIQAIEAMDGDADADISAAKELLGRGHPFDRSQYLRMHERLTSEGKQSPFSEKEAAGFRKKQTKFGFPGYRSPLAEIKRLVRRLKKSAGLF